MASLERQLTAVPVSVPRGRWSEYTQLSRQMKQAGLLARRRGWYAARIGLNLALLAAGCAAFAVIGASWWQLGTAAYLAVVFTPVRLRRPRRRPPPALPFPAGRGSICSVNADLDR
jgi:hypothetical protein